MMTDTELSAAMERNKTDYDSMSPAERAAMLDAQRTSWVRGEMGIGVAADEAAYQAALAEGDGAAIARLNAHEDERMRIIANAHQKAKNG